MTYARRVDANHSEIMSALRKTGASVHSLHECGDGVPDLAVGYRGRNYFFEVKDGNKTPSERKLNEEQVKWHKNWRGQVAVVETAIEAVEMLMRLSPRGVTHFCWQCGTQYLHPAPVVCDWCAIRLDPVPEAACQR